MEQSPIKNGEAKILVFKALRPSLLIALLLAMLAVLLGAFGAHALEGAVEEGRLEPSLLEAWHTGVTYQFYHVFAVILSSLLAMIMAVWSMDLEKAVSHAKIVEAPLSAVLKPFKRANYFFLLGILLFSGSLYLMAIGNLAGGNWSWLGPITPIGGLLYVVGWGHLAYAIWKS